MHPAQINAEIKKAGTSQSAIAETLGVSVAAVSAVIHSRLKSKRVREAISRVINKPVISLWPKNDTREDIKQRALQTAKTAIHGHKLRRSV